MAAPALTVILRDPAARVNAVSAGNGCGGNRVDKQVRLR